MKIEKTKIKLLTKVMFLSFLLILTVNAQTNPPGVAPTPSIQNSGAISITRSGARTSQLGVSPQTHEK
jgi:hypothetical protein